MNWKFWVILIIATAAAGCSQPVTSPESLTPSPSAETLPTPMVFTTSLPQPDTVAEKYLKAWQAFDYETMYNLLSEDSRAALSQEEFTKKYQGVADETTLQKINFNMHGTEQINPSLAEAKYSLTLVTNLIGNLLRDTKMNLKLENGDWKVVYDDEIILPDLAGGNSLRMDLNPFDRRSIFDRNGNPLAYQTEATSVGLSPEFVNTEEDDGLIGLLSRASGLTSSEIINRIENSAPGDYMALGELQSEENTNLLRALASYGAVVLTNYTARFYPGNGASPHLVGYASAIREEELDRFRQLGYRSDEKIGRKGIEAWGESQLSGQRGGTLYLLDSQNTPIAELGSSSSAPGEDIYSTIDRDFNLNVQEALRGFRGAAVVLERNTGRVLAMASSPGFDPNAFQVENYNWWVTLPGIVNDPNSPEFNRASQGLYPLGSVFKLVTAAAALESGLYTPAYTYDCQYLFEEVTGLTLHDWTYDRFLKDGETKPSGLLTLPQGLIRSCNPFFWHLGKGLFDQGKTTAVSDMARAFGLGSKTGIDVVDEEAGTIPDPQTVVDAVNIAIGQGNVQVTPLQVANFIAALGNGGTLYRPQAIEKIVSNDVTVTYQFSPEVLSRLPISPANLKVIQDAMVGVVKSKSPIGTASRVFNGFNIPVAGKTGTATSQTQDPHAWFAGYTDAGRADKPDIAIAVLVENIGEGSEYAAPIFRRIVESYFLGHPVKLYPWESSIGITETPTPLFQDTPTPEEQVNP